MFFSLTTEYLSIRENVKATKNAIKFEFNEELLNSTNATYRKEWIRVEVIDFINRFYFTLDRDLETIKTYFNIAQKDSLRLKL